MKLSCTRQVGSWLLAIAAVALTWFSELFFVGFILAGSLRPDLLSKEGSDAIISRYKVLAISGACYSAIVGIALVVLTYFVDRSLASSLGLRIIYIAFWPFALMFSLNEYRMFRQLPNNALQGTREDARA